MFELSDDYRTDHTSGGKPGSSDEDWKCEHSNKDRNESIKEAGKNYGTPYRNHLAHSKDEQLLLRSAHPLKMRAKDIEVVAPEIPNSAHSLLKCLGLGNIFRAH